MDHPEVYLADGVCVIIEQRDDVLLVAARQIQLELALWLANQGRTGA